MRAREFIIEAAWDGMVDRLYRQYPEQTEQIKTYVTWARNALKKQDRIVWFLKQFESDALKQGESVNTLVNRLQHFMGIEYNPIQNLVWGGQSAQILLAQLAGLEAEYKQKMAKEQPVAMQAGDRVIKRWNNGMEWVYTDRAYCADEGRSGKHCGNVVGKTETDQRILSLRNRGHVECTFILHADGQLGEMKARGNTKPRAELHPYILWLLEQPFVKGTLGGGYRPAANFDLKDLGPELVSQLQASRPDFADWADVAERRGKYQSLGRVALTDENEDMIDEIINVIMDFTRDDLEALLRDSTEDEGEAETLLSNLDEAIDYQARAEPIIHEFYEEGVEQGYYEEGSMTIKNIPMGLEMLISDWNNLGRFVDFNDVFDLVKVEAQEDQGTWSVRYRTKVKTGKLRA